MISKEERVLYPDTHREEMVMEQIIELIQENR